MQLLGAHVAPLAVKFYTGSAFPERYRNSVFIAEHGSWNRSEKSGYRITTVKLEGDRAVSYEPFATGFNRGNDVMARRSICCCWKTVRFWCPTIRRRG